VKGKPVAGNFSYKAGRIEWCGEYPKEDFLLALLNVIKMLGNNSTSGKY
jgi:hypothetical protein